ncbi:alcohol-forming fatty acyl-CoA reductase-like [Papaver somniferum]|uniref:alcohol-forming fatty acyl-CoA reductase-like n=1 Tax=Papaver somniferum TaxID=3469 RepID=UPI000E705CF9|nr:alcohol-forming fatty acyl-CoA reductase-like [Papaver somniferum]
MELNSVVKSLENQCILVTGATGFLAKLFVEKLLRIQPNVKQLFLLVRAPNSASAAQRINNEVSGEVFRVLREREGVRYATFISEKVTPVAGDISLENLGIDDSNLINKIRKEIDVVASFAATTKFDERYDDAIRPNTMGAKHVAEFSKKCEKLKLLVHPSTAYVWGERSGLILENPLRMGETLNGIKSPELDIKVEMELVSEKLNELRANQVSQKEEMIAMKEFGLERERLFGWPNTYVFTKAMGEMIIGEAKGYDHKVVILRHTIVTSTLKEPFPGWIEGVRTIDSVILACGKGNVRCFPVNPQTVADVIPGDMVVNAAIVAMVGHANQPSSGDDTSIYHVGSFAKAPLHGTKLFDYVYNYFYKNPMISPPLKKQSFGKPINIAYPLIFSTMTSFLFFFNVICVFPMKVFLLLNTLVFFDYLHDICSTAERKIKFIQRMVELFKPYSLFKGIFDDSNTEKLRTEVRMTEAEANIFYFDPKCINWDDYFMNVHIPGLVKYVFR